MKKILMNTEMTKAILDGRKVQTRIVFKDEEIIDTFLKNGGELNKIWVIDKHSKYQKGKTIWVGEPARVINVNDYQDCFTVEYLADGEKIELMYLDRWENKDGMFPPKWVEKYQGIPNGCIKEMARIFLKVTDVRVERLQDISYEDTMAEGCNIDISDCVTYDSQDQSEAVSYSAYCWYRDLWNKTAPKGYKWEDNPYVFVYEFERVEK